MTVAPTTANGGDMAGCWDQASDERLGPLLRGGTTIWFPSEGARMDGGSHEQEDENVQLQQLGSSCRQKLGGAGFAANSESGNEGG